MVSLFLLLLPPALRAHNPDTSYARCILAPDRVEVRLTYDVFTLQMITRVDTNNDARATRDELRAATSAIQRFLRAHVHLEIDGISAELGDASEPLWPGETGEGLAAPDWHTAAGLITFPFRQSRPAPAREVALQFDFFQTLSSRHTVLGAFEQGTQKEEVTFIEAEPDFLFDATFTATPTPAPSPPPTATSLPAVAPTKLPRSAWLLLPLALIVWCANRAVRRD